MTKPLLKRKLVATILLLGICSQGMADSLSAKFTNSEWDEAKIPQGQQCQKFGGDNPMTPEIRITGLPQGTEAVVLRFNDESFLKLKYGGHGQIAMLVESGTTEMVFPSVPGHSSEMPEGVLIVSKHKAPDWDKAGAYLPPCSGGMGNKYTVTIQPSKIKNLEKKKFKKISTIKLVLGTY